MILEWVYKPNFVLALDRKLARQDGKRLSRMASDGHSSRRRITPLAQATYPEVVAGRRTLMSLPTLDGQSYLTPPYLVLHHEEFA
jgi:hypothetical protein